MLTSRRLAILATCLSLALPAGAAAQRDAPATALRNPVEIADGRRLNVVCAGDRGPSIIFANGLGSSVLDWRQVQGEVARFARACVYDRAGSGYSDPSPHPSSASFVVEDLRALLDRGFVKKPVVIVGHSAGGLFATLYAERYPTDVAGLVLVDPSLTNQFRDWTRRYPAQRRRTLPILQKGKALLARCARLAQDGQLTLARPSICTRAVGLSPAGGYSSAELAYLSHQALNPAFYQTLIAEEEAALPFKGETDQNSVDESRERQSLGDIPVTVLTSGVRGINGVSATPEEEAAWREFWRGGHERLARKSSRGQAVELPNAGHLIQKDDPAAVVAAIRKVIAQGVAETRRR
ncbi:MAG: hypothetical protein B7Y99_12695 [Caulobacterales bacterium 32-69-10]|nr:MAG: hypothetical protein B7Y99_12695 [Caulobacterales bacterium 32-69-10]